MALYCDSNLNCCFPGVGLILCGFVVFTTGCFVLGLALLFVLVFLVLFIIVNQSFGDGGAGLCVSPAFIYLLCTR